MNSPTETPSAAPGPSAPSAAPLFANIRALCLASGSPRRRELILRIGLPVTFMKTDTGELATAASPALAAEQIAEEKANAALALRSPAPGEVIVAADTSVWIDSRMLGKPKDAADAEAMLRGLSGRDHEVVTGMALVYVGRSGQHCVRVFSVSTTVSVAPLSDAEIKAYVDTRDPLDKAGAYGIQGVFALHVRGINGDYNNVVGLPLAALYDNLKAIDAELEAPAQSAAPAPFPKEEPMTKDQALQKLEEYQRVLFALGHASGILSYDGNTVAPKKSAVVRAITQGELGRMSYELTTAPETEEMILALKAHEAELDTVTRRIAGELYREFDKMRRIPKDLFVEYQKLSVESDAVWHEAKVNNDFKSFEPYLQKMFDMSKQIALCTDPDKDPYDTQLDRFERGLDTATCDRFFATLKAGIVPLLRAVIDSPHQVNEPLLQGTFPIPVQREFSTYLMNLLGMDPERSIIGETEHPFTTDFSKNDVRITTHYHEDTPISSMYSVIHEGGHALYELNIGDELAMTMLGGGVSMGIHESQSRFFENIIGRSYEFCGVILPWLTEHFPAQLSGLTQERLYRAVNASRPSLIRTEADELTYCLHIMVRYELERMMFAGTITARELPEAWNRLYKEYLGIEVPSDREGVLQDSHWSFGAIGYFPSYAIGSAYGAQYLEEMNKSFDVAAAVAAGNLAPVSDWLREHIWQYGRLCDPSELFRRTCGEFRPEVFIAYLNKKYREIYKL